MNPTLNPAVVEFKRRLLDKYFERLRHVILDVHVLPRETYESTYYRDDFWLANVLREGIEL